MHRQSDSSTCELSRARLKLAGDLIFTPQQYDNRVFCHIEQPSRSRFFKIGWAEYTLISLLDGNTSLAEAISRAAAALGQEAFTEAEANSIFAWLIENDLAFTHESKFKPAAGPTWSRWWNPFWMKIPLCHPDHWLDRLASWLGWLHSGPALLLSFVIWLLAGFGLWTRWEEFSRSAQGVLAPTNWLWLGAAWLGLKLVHEFSHALACKRYGGTVPEMGTILVLFAPMAYVDVTSSWGFKSRWQRMHVAAAGMIVEFQIAALCAIWWMNTNSPQTAHLLFTVIFMASLTTILFNANPLMKFDGYYLLADLVNIPNLAANSSQFLNGVVCQWFLGMPVRQVGFQGWKGGFVRLYGIAAILWRLSVCAGLILAAALLFHGAGLILAIFAVVSWLCVPVIRAVFTWGKHTARHPGLVLRMVCSLLLFSGLGWLVWDIVPCPNARRAHGISEHAPLAIVRAETAGFVDRVLVADGQTVKAGDLLLVLTNEDLEIECQALEIEIRQSISKRRKYLDEAEIALAQVEAMHRQSLEKQLLELTARRSRLQVRAPISGQVMARELPWLKGRYLKDGSPILEIGSDCKEWQLAIAQPDISVFRTRLGQTVHVRLKSGETLVGELRKLEPRASESALHPALCAPVGGPLAVKANTAPQDDKQFTLTEPHLEGQVTFPKAVSHQLLAGRVGAVMIYHGTDTLGRVTVRRLVDWFRDREYLFQSRQSR